MSESLVRMLLFDAATAAAGGAVLAAAGWPVRRRLGRSLGLAYLAGTAWVGVGSSLLLMGGSSLSTVTVALLVVAPAALVPVRRQMWISIRGHLWFAAPAITAASLVAIRGTSYPMRGWDAWAFWTPRALSIIKLHGLQPAYLRSGVGNPDYPPLLPALEATYLRVQGTADTTLIHMQLGLLMVAFVTAAAVLLSPRAPAWCIGCVLFLLATAPGVYRQTLDAYADVPLAILAAMGALVGWSALGANRHRGASLLAVLFFAAAMLTKVEGAIFVAIIVVALVATRPAPRPVAWGAGVLTGSAAASFVPWHLWLHVHDVSGPYHFELHSALGTTRIFSAAWYLAAGVANPSDWLLLPLILGVTIVAAALGRRENHDSAFVVGTVLAAVVALDLIYAGTSYPFSWHVHTSVTRVIDTPVFIAATFAPLLVRPEDRALRDSSHRVTAGTPAGDRELT